MEIRSHRYVKVSDIKSGDALGYEFRPMDTRHLPIRYYTNQKALIGIRERNRSPPAIISPLITQIANYHKALEELLNTPDTMEHPALTDYADTAPQHTEPKTIRLAKNGTSFEIVNKNVVEGLLRVHKLESILDLRERIAKSPTKTVEVRAYMDPATNKWTVRRN
jgi:hypothetical protein